MHVSFAAGLLVALLMLFMVVPMLCMWMLGKSSSNTDYGERPKQRYAPPAPSARGSAQSLLEARPSVTLSQHHQFQPFRRSATVTSTPRATLDSTLGPTSIRYPPTSGMGAASSSGGLAGQVEVGPPPICPSLILPNTEARFMISMESLRNPGAAIDILGTSGRKLLHADINQSADGRGSLSLCSVGCEDDPRCTITAATSASSLSPLSSLEISGRGRRPYGTMEPGGPGWRGGVVTVGGKPVMIVETTPLPSGDLYTSLRMTASTMEGRLLAAADPTNDGRGHGEQSWKLQVKVTPGSDAVLISSCMLAVHILWPPTAPQAQASRGGLGPTPRGSELLGPTLRS
jgi:hypothetical protein